MGLTELGADECARGTKEGLFEKLDYSVIDTTASIPSWSMTIGSASPTTSVVLIYRTDVFGDKGPKTWADFWNVEKFPGRRALCGAFGDRDVDVAASPMACRSTRSIRSTSTVR